MRVLVTGAAGFIGRHVCKALWEAGHEVFEVDLVAPEGKGHLWTVHDITKPFSQSPVILDAVIHLAALAAPRECDANPTRAFDINVNGTLQVLRMALASGAKKVVFSSSAHVFDIPPKWLPTDESAPLRLNNTYTTTKILGEQLCELFWTNHGLPYTILRLYNADVADAFVKAITSEFVGPVNIGTGIETDLGTIASIIAKAYEVKLDCHPAAVPTRMCADWKRAKRILG